MRARHSYDDSDTHVPASRSSKMRLHGESEVRDNFQFFHYRIPLRFIRYNHNQVVHVLRGPGRGSRSPVRRYAPLRGGPRCPARLPQSPVRRLGGRYLGLHIFLHARLPAVESREEEDVLGTVGIEMQIVVRARRRRWAGGRIVRLLQRLRRREPLVGPDAGKSLHAESRPGTVQVRSSNTFPKKSSNQL